MVCYTSQKTASHCSSSRGEIRQSADGNAVKSRQRRDFITAENVFWVPKQARWSYLQTNAKQPAIARGAEEIEDDDEPFDEKVKRLTIKLDEQFRASAQLEQAIRENLRQLKQ